VACGPLWCRRRYAARSSVADRLYAAERALADPAVRDQAVREAAEIVQHANREIAGSTGNLSPITLLDALLPAALEAVRQVAS
jgi:hypothetical protein